MRYIDPDGMLSTESPSYNDYSDDEKKRILSNLEANGPRGGGDKNKKPDYADVIARPNTSGRERSTHFYGAPTAQEWSENPIDAAILSAGWVLMQVLGLDAVDNSLDIISDPDASLDEKIVAGIQGSVGVGGLGKGRAKAPRSIRNSHLAQLKHPVTGVPFDKKGFPDFSKHLYKKGINDVKIKPTGNRASDFDAANTIANYSETPKGYTWHHHQTTGRM